MNSISELIDNFLADFQFDFSVQEKIKTDLLKVIAQKFILEIDQDMNKLSYVDRLSEACEAGDGSEIQQIMKTLMEDSGFTRKLEEITKKTLSDWLSEMNPAFSDIQKHSAQELTALLNAA